VVIEKLNKLGVVVVVLALVIVIDGLFFYRFRYRQPVPSVENIATVTPARNTAFEKETRTLVHSASLYNSVENHTYIDHAFANENPDAILLTEQTSQFDRTDDDAPPKAVWYNAYRGKWAVFNQYSSPMYTGATFDINIAQEPGESVFVHRATPDNTLDNETYIDHTSANENPDAVLKVTPNFNPGGGAGTFDKHPLNIRYDTDKEKWAIFNSDLEPLPQRAAFNIGISEGTPTSDE
jgi:hypothetical protein